MNQPNILAMKTTERESHNAKVCFKAIKKFGEQSQLDIAIEELSELIKAILKTRRITKESKSKLIEDVASELADVQIVCFQVQHIFGIENNAISEIINSKIDRLEKLINE